MRVDEAPWVFGYGSLIWRPGFEYSERRVGYIVGLSRRFYQGSPDHRGRPEAPGRVVTLIPEPGARCYGVAYRLCPEVVEEVLSALDHREQGGYERLRLDVHPARPGEAMVRDALVYLANETNPHYLGPAPLEEMARHICASAGPSGRNEDYLLELAASLRRLALEDPHVFALERLVLEELRRRA